MQGRDYHYRYYPAATTEYARRIVADRKEDTGMLDREGAVAMCSVCGSVIEKQADEYATLRTQELRSWITPILDSHSNALQTLAARIARLESMAHTH
jgi:hypothetical protein